MHSCSPCMSLKISQEISQEIVSKLPTGIFLGSASGNISINFSKLAHGFLQKFVRKFHLRFFQNKFLQEVIRKFVHVIFNVFLLTFLSKFSLEILSAAIFSLRTLKIYQENVLGISPRSFQEFEPKILQCNFKSCNLKRLQFQEMFYSDLQILSEISLKVTNF